MVMVAEVVLVCASAGGGAVGAAAGAPGGAVDVGVVVGVVVFSPQLCVGFLFLILYPGFLLLRLPPPLSHTLTQAQLCHIASLTYNNFT